MQDSPDEEEEDSEDDMEDFSDDVAPQKRRKVELEYEIYSDEDSDDAADDADDCLGLKWKDNLVERAQESFLARQRETKNLQKLVYGDGIEEEEDEMGEMFRGIKNRQTGSDKVSAFQMDGLDSSKFPTDKVQDWKLEEVRST